MWKALRSVVGLPAVAVLLFLGIALLVVSATAGGALGTFFGGILALVCFVLGFAMMFAVYIKRMNEDIDSDRHDLRQELDEAMKDVDSEE
jgi:uncharacterized membrane protein YdjX (TVP38/TMEM64 family)